MSETVLNLENPQNPLIQSNPKNPHNPQNRKNQQNTEKLNITKNEKIQTPFSLEKKHKTVYIYIYIH